MNENEKECEWVREWVSVWVCECVCEREREREMSRSPPSLTTSSFLLILSAYSIVYTNPLQPPFFTPIRIPVSSNKNVLICQDVLAHRLRIDKKWLICIPITSPLRCASSCCIRDRAASVWFQWKTYQVNWNRMELKVNNVEKKVETWIIQHKQR
jgi:hypothetical protein